MKKLFLRTLAGIGLVLGVLVINLIWFKPFFIREFYERTFLRFALDSPEILSSLRLLEPLGLRGHNRELDNASLAFEDDQLARLHKDLATLHSYDTTGMGQQARLSYRILDWYMTDHAGRGGEVSLRQLPGQPAFWGAERVSHLHGDHAPGWRCARCGGL